MLANYLKQHFEQNDMHPALVARKLETSRSVVHNWLNGDSTPNFKHCCKIADLLAQKEHRSAEEVLTEMKEEMEKEVK